jgi:hypothetical protein
LLRERPGVLSDRRQMLRTRRRMLQLRLSSDLLSRRLGKIASPGKLRSAAQTPNQCTHRGAGGNLHRRGCSSPTLNPACSRLVSGRVFRDNRRYEVCALNCVKLEYPAYGSGCCG